MKPISLLIAIAYAAIVFIVLPSVVISLNEKFSFPILQNSVGEGIGIVFGVIGIVIASYSYFLFPKIGKGSPVPTSPAKILIEKGLYRYSRNPIYISHLLLILAGSFFIGHILLFAYTFLCFLSYNWYITHVEEPELKKRFDNSYSAIL